MTDQFRSLLHHKNKLSLFIMGLRWIKLKQFNCIFQFLGLQGQINRNMNLKSQIPGPRIKRTSGSCCISKRWIVDDSLFINIFLHVPLISVY